MPHYILIDFENLQPETDDLLRLRRKDTSVIYFVGANQCRAPRLLSGVQSRVQKLIRAGCDASIEKTTCSGRNLLDQVLIFHIGQMHAKNADATFCVVSRDKGFDGIVQHLNSIGVSAYRWYPPRPLPLEDQCTLITKTLIKMKPGRPKTLGGLWNVVQNSYASWALSKERFDALCQELVARQVFALDDTAIVYADHSQKPSKAKG